MKSELRLIIALWLGSALPSAVGAGKIEQPIQYNHKLHIQEVGSECVDCHRYVNVTARATIPNIGVCGECHEDEPITESTEELKLLEYVSSGERIPWKKVYRLPSHVYFSHRRHTVIGNIDCKVCHGDVREMASPIGKQHVSIKMGECMKCHEETGVDNDCTRCHR